MCFECCFCHTHAHKKSFYCSATLHVSLTLITLSSLAIECQVPKVMFGIRIEGNPPYSYKSEARFKCEPGYTMKGSDTAVCEENVWSVLPECVQGMPNLLHVYSFKLHKCFSSVCIGNTRDKPRQNLRTWHVLL